MCAENTHQAHHTVKDTKTALVRISCITYTHSADFIRDASKVNPYYLHSGLLVFPNAFHKNSEGNINDVKMTDSYKKNLEDIKSFNIISELHSLQRRLISQKFKIGVHWEDLHFSHMTKSNKKDFNRCIKNKWYSL